MQFCISVASKPHFCTKLPNTMCYMYLNLRIPFGVIAPFIADKRGILNGKCLNNVGSVE